VGGSFDQISHRGEALVLQALVTHPAAGSIAEDTAAIQQRASALVSSDDEVAIKIAIVATGVGGSRADQYLGGFAAGVTERPEILHKLSSSLKFDLVKRYPTLLTSPELWKVSVDQQLVIAAQLSSLHNTGDHQKGITKAVLAANAWPALTSIIAQFRDGAVGAILEWIENIQQTPLSVPEPVLVALGEHRHLVLEVIRKQRIGPHALRAVSAILDPRADSVRALGNRVWVEALGLGVRLAPVEAELRSKAFALSIGLSLAGDGDVDLVREGFSAVYDAARRDCLPEEVWAFVEPYLPWYLVTWDRCARLIRGVVRLFLDRQWPASDFLSTFQTGEEFRRALEEADTTRRGSMYIKRICDQTQMGSLTPDDAHADALKRYCG